MTKIAALGTQLTEGIAQVETATVVGTITGSGNATVVYTASGMTGTPITRNVAVLNLDTSDTVATKIVADALTVANITNWFNVSCSGSNIVLQRKLAAANDGTMNLSTANGTCTGLTGQPTSANTTAGAAYVVIAYVKKISGPGLKGDTTDVTTHDDATAFEEVVPGLLRSGDVSIDLVYDPNAATHGATSGLVAKAQNKTLSAFQLIFPGPYEWDFFAYVTEFNPTGDVGGALTATAKMKITGSPVLV